MNQEKKPRIGPFFYIDKRIVSRNVDFDTVEVDGGYRDVSLSHFQLFNMITKKEEWKKYQDYDYSYFPRGRVLYDVKDDTFKVFIDHCLDKPFIKMLILKRYHLVGCKVKFDFDEHYKCAGCDPEIKENQMYMELNSQEEDL